MQATDFSYDGLWLSDLGFMICTFDSGGVENATAGSYITFNSVKQHNGKRFALMSSEYEEAFTATFDICKMNNSGAGEDITIDEFRFIMRWLNRREYHTFSLVDNHEEEWNEVFFEGSFNVERINYSGRLVGLSLTFTANRPFGLGKELVENLDLWHDNVREGTIFNRSDEIGITYPEQVIITCHADGDLSITNSFDNSTVSIKNCSSGEVLTMDCVNQIITTSDNTHLLYNDFNYTFFRICSDYMHIENVYAVNQPCEITVRYRPVRKVVF